MGSASEAIGREPQAKVRPADRTNCQAKLPKANTQPETALAAALRAAFEKAAKQ